MTLRHVRNIGAALEEFATVSKEDEYPCIRSVRDFPAALAAKLTPEDYLDGYGRPIIVLATARSYVVMSLGSDGAADRQYAGESFEEDSGGDFIYSNGEWVHHPSGLSTTADKVPKVADALAEVATCGAGR